MTNLRQAAQQALEALEEAKNGSQKTPTESVINALRTALEQQAEAVPAGLTLAVIGNKHFGNPIPSQWYAAAKELISSTAPPQRKPLTDEPYESPYNPNPVEYQYHYPDGSWRCSNGEVINGMHPDIARSLYALKDNT